jgi:hypothetical protein
MSPAMLNSIFRWQLQQFHVRLGSLCRGSAHMPGSADTAFLTKAAFGPPRLILRRDKDAS